MSDRKKNISSKKKKKTPRWGGTFFKGKKKGRKQWKSLQSHDCGRKKKAPTLTPIA